MREQGNNHGLKTGVLEKTVATSKPIQVHQEMFGDIVITLYRERNGSGSLFVRMSRGNPMEKTFCIEHFVEVAEKFRRMQEIINQKIGI